MMPIDDTITSSVPAPSTAARSMLRLLRSLWRHAPGATVLVLLLTFALILTSGVSLIMLVPLMGVAGLDVDAGNVGRLAELVANLLGSVGLSLTVPVVIVTYLAIVLTNAALGRTRAIRSARLHQGYAMALRERVHEGITMGRWASFVKRPSSTFVYTLTQEVERVGGALSGVLHLIVRLVMAAIYLGLALYVSFATTLLVAVCGGTLMAMLARKTRLGREKGQAVSNAYEALYGAISEHLAGLRVTKSHGVEPLYLRRFAERVQSTAGAQVDVVRNQADVGFWLEIGSAAIMAAVFGTALLGFEMPMASILLLLYLFARLVPMLTDLQRQVQTVFALIPAVDRVEEVSRWLAEHAEPAGPQLPAPELADALRLERVGFGYDGLAGPAILHGVDLEVRAGRTTAIVGPSGGGKSTVADLVVGLLTPDEGRVTVDGVPLEGTRVAAWRRRIGYVNQDTFLFHDTIRANLLFVRPEATEDELREALRSASATFVEDLPARLDTIAGDRGVRLSGGERQRIALARAILRRPAMLVLDEATSALDPENERVIQDAIARMAGQQTILLIAHRLASVRGADTIHVIEQGRVIERGGWDELTSRPGGRFREMCRAQGLLEDPDSVAAATA
jgi:ATP-binding cassette, subfamily C, bacterial